MKTFESMDRPDPSGDALKMRARILKTSHDAAVSEWKGLLANPEEASS